MFDDGNDFMTHSEAKDLEKSFKNESVHFYLDDDSDNAYLQYIEPGRNVRYIIPLKKFTGFDKEKVMTFLAFYLGTLLNKNPTHIVQGVHCGEYHV